MNPWITITPVGEPHEWEIGSQPSMTAASLADVTSEFLAAPDRDSTVAETSLA